MANTYDYKHITVARNATVEARETALNAEGALGYRIIDVKHYDDFAVYTFEKIETVA